MVSRETRVYLTGLALSVTLVLLTGPVLDTDLNGAVGALVNVLFFPVLPFLLPQLYLTVTGDEAENVPPRTRVRVGFLVSGLVVAGLYAAADSGTPGRLVLGVIAGVLLGSLFVHEMVLGYRSSSLFEDANAE